MDPAAPWEQLEFIQVGHKTWQLSPVTSAVPPIHPAQSSTRPLSPTSTPLESAPAAISINVESDQTDALLPITLHERFVERLPRGSVVSFDAHDTIIDSQRSSESKIPTPPELRYDCDTPLDKSQSLTPVVSDSEKAEAIVSEDVESLAGTERRPSDNALRDFLQENQLSGRDDFGTGTNNGTGTNGRQPMSATAYFNRQASLLMLYFPLAVSAHAT